MCVKEFEKIITLHRLSKEQALAAVEEVFAKKTEAFNLKVVSCFDEAAAVVALIHKDEPIAESIFLDDKFFDSFHFNKPFINIAFLEPIGHDASIRESVLLIQNWAKTHYPQSLWAKKNFC